MAEPDFSVIIPAHDEAAVIGRCLSSLLEDAPPGAMEIVVVCNGCSDNTAEVARKIAPDAKIVEIGQGSKPLALNTGKAMARSDTLLFVDADIVVNYHSLAACADELRSGRAMVAAPLMQIEKQACSRLVRDYYHVWEGQPYVQDGMVGSGVFGLSGRAMEIVGEFPPIIADDEFIRTRFPSAQRKCVRADANGRPVFFRMYPPRDLGSLIRIESRQRAGMAELHALYPSEGTAEQMTSFGSLVRTWRKGNSALQLANYVAIKIAGRMRFRWSHLRGRQGIWLRDNSSRSA